MNQTLTPTEIVHLWARGMTYADIAAQAGTSRQRVQQLLRPDEVMRDIVYLRADGRCEHCRTEPVKGHIHHRNRRISEFNSPDNLQYLCNSCHKRLHPGHRGKPKPAKPKSPWSRFAKLGNVARNLKLTPEQRSDIARKAVQARWAKEKGRGK